MSDEGKKTGRGGAREGAGRKKGVPNAGGTLRDKNLSIRISSDEIAAIKARAADAGKPMSQYIIDCALGR